MKPTAKPITRSLTVQLPLSDLRELKHLCTREKITLKTAVQLALQPVLKRSRAGKPAFPQRQ